MFEPWVRELQNSMFEPKVEPGFQVFEPRVQPWVRVSCSPHPPRCSNLGFGNTANTYAHDYDYYFCFYDYNSYDYRYQGEKGHCGTSAFHIVAELSL